MEFEGEAGAGVEGVDGGGGGDQHFYVVVVEFVDQVDEAAGGVGVTFVHGGDAGQEDGVEGSGYFYVVGGAAGLLAEGFEAEPYDAIAAVAGLQDAAVDFEFGVEGAVA